MDNFFEAKCTVLWAVTLIADPMENVVTSKRMLELQLDLQFFCKANFPCKNVLAFLIWPITPQYLFRNLYDVYCLYLEMIIWLAFFFLFPLSKRNVA